MDFLRLMKLLYLADRECLAEEGETITGDRMSALPQGPVLSTVMRLVNGTDSQSATWARHIRRGKNHSLHLVDDPGTDILYQFEKEIIRRVYEKYETIPTWDIVSMTHRLPEWLKYEGQLNSPDAKNSYPISIEDVLEGIGKPELISVVEERIAEKKHYEELFGGSPW